MSRFGQDDSWHTPVFQVVLKGLELRAPDWGVHIESRYSFMIRDTVLDVKLDDQTLVVIRKKDNEFFLLDMFAANSDDHSRFHIHDPNSISNLMEFVENLVIPTVSRLRIASKAFYA